MPNYTSTLLEKEELVGDKEHNIKWSAASLYGGLFPRILLLLSCWFLMVDHDFLGGADTVSLDSPAPQ